MTKRTKIIYWVATFWLCLGMVSTGIVQIIQMEEERSAKNERIGLSSVFPNHHWSMEIIRSIGSSHT
jgi:hypothetical protein